MNQIQSPRGTRDILPDQQPAWRFLYDTARTVAKQLAFKEITIPTYEELVLFQRVIGAGTDIMDKELFLVKGIKSEEGSTQYALRPEGTAGIVRSFIEHGMHTWPQPVRLFSFVNNFRYDRPQKGRYREHAQISLEYFGDFGPFADAWVIYSSWLILSKLGLKNINLELNTLGNPEELVAYSEILKKYLAPHRSELSTDSQNRLGNNPLRILDSKDSNDKKLVAGVPNIFDTLGEASQTHFKEVRAYLDSWKIGYTLNNNLVRGLDYYSHTAFEWTVIGNDGQQGSLGAGGRYNKLIPQLGGPDVGAVGGGLGLDRIIEEMERQGLLKTLSQSIPDAYIVAADEPGKALAIHLIADLTGADLSIDANLSKDSVGAQLKAAGKSGARFAIIIGQAEVEAEEVTLKDLGSGEQRRVARKDLVDLIKHEGTTRSQ